MLSFFEGVYVADLVSFLCGVVFFEGWSMLFILLVFYVVCFWRFYIAHFFSFLCCAVFLGGEGLCCSYC